MAMGTRQSEQGLLWVATAELPKSPGHPFYTRLNALLDADDFDGLVEGQCARFYAPVMGRPAWRPGGTSGCCWSATLKGSTRNAGSLGARAIRGGARFCAAAGKPAAAGSIRRFRGRGASSASRVTVRSSPWVQQRLVAAGLLKGKTVAVDATILEANAAMHNIVRRDTGERYQGVLDRARAGIGNRDPHA